MHNGVNLLARPGMNFSQYFVHKLCGAANAASAATTCWLVQHYCRCVSCASASFDQCCADADADSIEFTGSNMTQGKALLSSSDCELDAWPSSMGHAYRPALITTLFGFWLCEGSQMSCPCDQAASARTMLNQHVRLHDRGGTCLHIVPLRLHSATLVLTLQCFSCTRHLQEDHCLDRLNLVVVIQRHADGCSTGMLC